MEYVIHEAVDALAWGSIYLFVLPTWPLRLTDLQQVHAKIFLHNSQFKQRCVCNCQTLAFFVSDAMLTRHTCTGLSTKYSFQFALHACTSQNTSLGPIQSTFTLRFEERMSEEHSAEIFLRTSMFCWKITPERRLTARFGKNVYDKSTS